MATRRWPILGVSTVPDTTGRCWIEPYTILATNDVWGFLVLRLKDPSAGQAHGFFGQFTVPDDYVTSPVIVPIWSSTAVAGSHRMRFSYRTVGGDDTTSLDQAGFEEQVSLTDAAPGATNRRMAPTGLALTAGNFTVGETVEYLFERLDDTGVDTMAADSVIIDLFFQYSDV